MSFAKNFLSLSLLSSFSLPALAYTVDCSKPANDIEVSQCAQDSKNDAEKALNDEYAKAKERIKQELSDSQSDTTAYLNLFLQSQRG